MQNRSALETIKSKLPIESVVGSYVKLDKVGNKFKGKCPFHNEKTPSFQVDPDRKFYYCFGCHKGGDIFNFIEEIEGVDFVDALKMLAEKAGVKLDEYQNDKPSRLGVLREIVEASTKFYEVLFRKDKSVVDYLLNRGMTKETMVAWRIGYAPKGWSNLYDYLKKKYSDADILATGLCLKSDRTNGLYDRFRERIMFPISDSQGRVIGFTGRVMPGTEESTKPVGKYINSPETDLYHKSSVIYGFDKAKTAIHQNGFAIIVEGQMDCLMAYQSGTQNIVALSGTACTDEQIAQLKRFTSEITLCLDDDLAGLVASQKSAMVAYRHEMKVTVVSIDQGKDPADLILENPELWKTAIANRKDFISFRLDKMKQKEQSNNKIEIAKKELFPILQQMQFQISIDEKLQEIAKSFQVSVDAIRKDFDRFTKGNLPEPEAKKPLPVLKPGTHKEETKDKLLGILLALNADESFADLKKQFEDLGLNYETLTQDLPADKRARLIAETEQAFGPILDNAPAYTTAFTQFHIRYHLLLLDEAKHILDASLAERPDDERALAKLHSILKEKDRLIHQLHNR